MSTTATVPLETNKDELSTKRRLSRLSVIAALVCPGCGELENVVTSGEYEYVAADFGISTLSEWRDELDGEVSWCRSNAKEVRRILPELRRERPEFAAAIERDILGSEYGGVPA